MSSNELDPVRPHQPLLNNRVLAVTRNLHFDVVAIEILTELDRAGVEAVLLKGASFVGWLYEQDEAPIYGDVDILIRPSQQQEASKILSELGFRSFDGLAARALPGLGVESNWVRRDRARVDLHWSLSGVSAQPAHLSEVLLGNTETFVLRGAQVPILSEPARLFHVCIHALQHGPLTKKPMEDLKKAAMKIGTDQWLKAAELAKQLNCLAEFDEGLHLDPNGARIATQLGIARETSRDTAIRASSLSPQERPDAVRLSHFRELGFREKVGAIVKAGCPPPSTIRRLYGGKTFYSLVTGYGRHLLDIGRRFRRGSRALSSVTPASKKKSAEPETKP